MNVRTALSIGERGVISLIGAGGKTACMYALAKELVCVGKRVLTTTTTKIFMPTREESPATIVAGTCREMIKQAESHLRDNGHLTIGSEYLPAQGKLKGVDPHQLEAIGQTGIFDFIIVEADGAAGRALKVCASHEPVVPGFSNRIVSFVGLDVVGRPLTEDWVFRSDLFSRITGLPLAHPVAESSIVAAMLHDMSSITAIDKDTLKIAFLNKADDHKARVAGDRVASLLEERGKGLFHRVIIGQLKTEPAIHKCVALKDRYAP